MPSELRVIRFRVDEVEAALRMLAPRIGLILPEGGFSAPENDSMTEIPSTTFQVAGQEKRISVQNGPVAASMINYCKCYGIPLPKDGKKKLFVSSDFLELRFTLSHSAHDAPSDQRQELHV